MADPTSTVPGPGTPAPADNHITKTVSDSMSGNYGRPTAGGNVTGTADAPAGAKVPGPGAYTPPPAAAPSAGGTQVGPNMGAGATIVIPNSGDRPSGAPDSAISGGGTVGASGSQADAPAGVG